MAIYPSSEPRRRTRLLHRATIAGFAAAVLTVGSVFALTVQKYSRSKPLSTGWLASPNSSPSPLPNSQTAFTAEANSNSGQKAPADMEVETVSIKPSGFEPSEIRRPAGRFLLAVNNRGKPAEFFIEIYRADAQRAYEVRAKKGQQRQRMILDLPAGPYVLKERNHPEWSCNIVLSAK